MRHPGFAELVGFEVFPESDGTGKGQLTVSECHLNPNGVVHGGALFTLVDTAMGASLMQRLDEGEICATLQISMNFLRPVVGGFDIAEDLNKPFGVMTVDQANIVKADFLE